MHREIFGRWTLRSCGSWSLLLVVALIAIAARALWSRFQDRNDQRLEGKKPCSDYDWRPAIEEGKENLVIGKSYDEECEKCSKLRSELTD
jgi:hypothetical protein